MAHSLSFAKGIELSAGVDLGRSVCPVRTYMIAQADKSPALALLPGKGSVHILRVCSCVWLDRFR